MRFSAKKSSALHVFTSHEEGDGLGHRLRFSIP
jgi:hypothetical protein